MVGMEKIAAKQSVLQNLKEVSLGGCGVNSIDLAIIKEICPSSVFLENWN